MTRRITCITKHPNHEDRHRRIQAVGGNGWKDLKTLRLRTLNEIRMHTKSLNKGKRSKLS